MNEFKKIAIAITQLLDPLLEVAIHDMNTETISFISGSLSKRKQGDPSLMSLKDLNEDSAWDNSQYPKLNFDGKLIKSISIPLKENGVIHSVMCINCDISVFEKMQQLSQLLLKKEKAKPQGLFVNDWKEKLHKVLHERLQSQGLRLNELNTKQKKEVIHYLYLNGIFNEKRSTEYVSEILPIGRATIFKYLKTWKNND